MSVHKFVAPWISKDSLITHYLRSFSWPHKSNILIEKKFWEGAPQKCPDFWLFCFLLDIEWTKTWCWRCQQISHLIKSRSIILVSVHKFVAPWIFKDFLITHYLRSFSSPHKGTCFNWEYLLLLFTWCWLWATNIYSFWATNPLL